MNPQLGSLGLAPQGMEYNEKFLSPEEERRIVSELTRVEENSWSKIRMRGIFAKRTMLCYGFHYISTSRSLCTAPPIPDFLKELREKCAGSVGASPEDFSQVIVSRYPIGAGINWHCDAPIFGDVIMGISVKAVCRMLFRRDGVRSYKLVLEPKSLLILKGEARHFWLHRIPPVKALRFSITFRSLRQQAE